MADAFIIRMQMDPLPGGDTPTTAWVARAPTPEEARRLADWRAGKNGWWVKEVVEAPAGTVERLKLARGQITDYT
jgi:hypothetical protein